MLGLIVDSIPRVLGTLATITVLASRADVLWALSGIPSQGMCDKAQRMTAWEANTMQELLHLTVHVHSRQPNNETVFFFFFFAHENDSMSFNSGKWVQIITRGP